MRRLAVNLTLTALLLFGLSVSKQDALAQGMAQGSGIGFRNDLKTPVIVQGVSVVNNMQRRGQPFLVNPGKIVWDNNLAVGMRYYTVYEASQQRILLHNRPVRVQAGDQFFAVHMVTLNGMAHVKMNQEKVPAP